MSTLRELVTGLLDEWDGYAKRPLWSRCQHCPDGDCEPQETPGEPYSYTKTNRHGTPKTITMEGCTLTRMICKLCGKESVPAASIGPLFDWGASAAVDSISKKLKEFLEKADDK